MPKAKIKNWAEFQHYKDRSPPWLKLHRGLLDDFDFQRLPIASKALAPMIWLIAAESKDGEIEIGVEFLAFRLRWSEEDIAVGLSGLIEKGFIVVDSDVLEDCYQHATPETETETETEGEEKARKRAPTGKMTFSQWAEKLGDEQAIHPNDPVYRWADDAGIPDDFLLLAWLAFEDRYRREAKRYADWRQVFRNAVKGNWLKIWFARPEGGFVLTTTGETWKRVAAKREAA